MKSDGVDPEGVERIEVSIPLDGSVPPCGWCGSITVDLEGKAKPCSDPDCPGKPARGMIIQITDETHHWYPALLIVDEVKSWGVQAYAIVPEGGRSPKSTVVAPIRIETGRFQVVGASAVQEAT